MILSTPRPSLPSELACLSSSSEPGSEQRRLTPSAVVSGCNIDRPAGASADGRLILANHNRNYEVLGIDLPDLVHAGDTNSVASITAQTNTCKGLYGRVPNVVLVSFPDLLNI